MMLNAVSVVQHPNIVSYSMSVNNVAITDVQPVFSVRLNRIGAIEV